MNKKGEDLGHEVGEALCSPLQSNGNEQLVCREGEKAVTGKRRTRDDDCHQVNE